MGLEKRTIINEFKHELDLPNKDFTDRITKELRIKLIKDNSSSVKYMRGTRCGTHVSKVSYFEVIIPKYLKDYLTDRLPEYDRFKEDKIFHCKNKNFITKVRTESLSDLESTFEQLTSDALFLKELDNLEKLNKVIFIKTSFIDHNKSCNYNRAKLNKEVGTNFHYFVAYEKMEKRDLQTEYHARYYGLSRMPNTMGHHRNNLPYIGTVDFSSYIKIKWTQEREDYLFKIQERILDLSANIHNYLSTINDKNFELVMKEQTNLLEHKSNKTNLTTSE